MSYRIRKNNRNQSVRYIGSLDDIINTELVRREFPVLENTDFDKEYEEFVEQRKKLKQQKKKD